MSRDYLEHKKANSIISRCNEKTADKACCKSDEKALTDKCSISEKENKKFRAHRGKMNKSRHKRNKKPYKVRDKTWKDAHCKKLLFSLRTDVKKQMEKFERAANEMSEDLLELPEGLIKDKIIESSINYGKKTAVRHVVATGLCGSAGAVGGTAVAPGPGTVAGGVAAAGICNVGALVLDAGSAVWTVYTSVNDVWTTWDHIEEASDNLKKAIKDAKKIMKAANDPDKLKQLKKEMGDEMEQVARNNPCLKARRCKLVTQKKDPRQKDNLNQTGKRNTLSDTFGMGDTRGCCSGQTGHHLIQDAWLKSPPVTNEVTGRMKAMPRGAGDLCEAYDENKAPMVCVEGAGNTEGSHGKIHSETEYALQKKLENREGDCKNGFTMDCAIEVAVKAHKKTFGECDPTCLEAQLKGYYDRLRCKPRPTDRNGKEIVIPEDDATIDDSIF